MRLTGFLGCVLVAAPLGLAAQNGGYGVAGMENVGPIVSGGDTSTPVVTLPNPCPVSVQASHLSDGSVMKTRVDHPIGIGQRLHLKLTSPDQRTIDSATVSLQGWTATGRITQAGTKKDTGLETRTLTVFLIPGADRAATVDVWASGLTAVESVELLSVKYSDGSTWTPTQGKTCSVAPDHLMLISHR